VRQHGRSHEREDESSTGSNTDNLGDHQNFSCNRFDTTADTYLTTSTTRLFLRKYSFIFGRVRRCSFDARRQVLCPSSAFPKRRVALVAHDSGQIRERRLDTRPVSHRRGQSHKGLLHDILGSNSSGSSRTAYRYRRVPYAS
jgi:hypothetical protein